MTNNKELDKELEELSFIIKDGFYKDCKVYHESVKSFLEEKLKSQKETLCLEYDKQYLKREEKLIEKIKEAEDNYKKELLEILKEPSYIGVLDNNEQRRGYEKAHTEIINLIKNK